MNDGLGAPWTVQKPFCRTNYLDGLYVVQRTFEALSFWKGNVLQGLGSIEEFEEFVWLLCQSIALNIKENGVEGLLRRSVRAF